MNAQNAHEYLPLIYALANGKTIQTRYDETVVDYWYDADEINFAYPSKCYRVKPDPRTFEIWVHKEGGDIHHWIPPNWNEDNSWERITVQEVL